VTSSSDPVRSSPAGPTRGRGRLARWAVGLATAVLVVLAVSYAIFGAAYGFGGSAAISDTFVGYLAGFAVIGGLSASLLSFALAITARVKHDRSASLATAPSVPGVTRHRWAH